MPFSGYQRKVTGDGFSATQIGKLQDVNFPEGTMLSFDVDPALCRRRDKLVFEFLGSSFAAPGWLIHDKTEPAN